VDDGGFKKETVARRVDKIVRLHSLARAVNIYHEINLEATIWGILKKKFFSRSKKGKSLPFLSIRDAVKKYIKNLIDKFVSSKAYPN